MQFEPDDDFVLIEPCTDPSDDIQRADGLTIVKNNPMMVALVVKVGPLAKKYKPGDLVYHTGQYAIDLTLDAKQYGIMQEKFGVGHIEAGKHSAKPVDMSEYISVRKAAALAQIETATPSQMRRLDGGLGKVGRG